MKETARSVALDVLDQCGQKEGFVQRLLDRKLATSTLAGPDRRLVTQLVYGVLRRRGTLDALLRPLVTRSPDKVEPWLWDVLRLGAYQLVFLDHVPPHAAVFETVQLANRQGRPGAKGFLNGVLRSLLRQLTDERTDAPAADAVPLENERYRRLLGPVLPAPDALPVEYLSAAFALPQWLVGRWLERFGWHELLRLGFWFASPAPLWIRSNALRITRAALLARFAETGIAAEPGRHPQAIRLVDQVPVRDLPGFAEGYFVVQDESAMQVATALAPAPGSRVLDLCAAPGGKTSHLAELMDNHGTIFACDIDEARLASVKTTCSRLGIDIVATEALAAGKEIPPGPFDAVLVDVPCSNTGVLGRRPEARWRLSANEIRRLVPQQVGLLRAACQRVKPEGAVVYSTCSIEPEENQQVVQTVLKEMPNVLLEAETEQIPGRPADGGYYARLRRTP